MTAQRATFSEDPLWVIGMARVAAYFGLSIAPHAQLNMAQEVADGRLNEASPERIWEELSKALKGPRPAAFIHALHECGALNVLLPEVEALYGIPQHAQWHPEIDTGVHTEMVVAMAARLAPGNLPVMWAALTHDLGKALTDPEHWPRHHQHETLGLRPLADVHARYPVPMNCRLLAERVCEDHLGSHTCFESRPGTLMKLFERLEGFEKPDQVRQFTLACEADKRGRGGMAETPYDQAPFLLDCLAAAQRVQPAAFADSTLTGEALIKRVRDARISAIKQVQVARKMRETPNTQTLDVSEKTPARPRSARP